MITSLKQRKIKFKPKIKLNHNIVKEGGINYITLPYEEVCVPLMLAKAQKSQLVTNALTYMKHFHRRFSFPFFFDNLTAHQQSKHARASTD